MPRSHPKRLSRRSSADVSGGPPSDDPPVDKDKLQDPANPSLDSSYREAVACLVHCEAIIGDLEDQVTQKDKHIASLEERLVQMSLELAKAKADQDERSMQYSRYRRSVSAIDQDEDGEGGFSQSSPALIGAPSPSRRDSSGWGRRSGNSNSSSDDAECPSAAETTMSASWTSVLDESSSSRLSMNIGGLFRRAKANLEPEGAMARDSRPEGTRATTKMAHKKQEPSARLDANTHEEKGEERLPRRRPPNKRRNELGKSSRSFLEASGVVFPSTFEDVVSKGCMERKSSSRALQRERRGR